MKRSQSEHVERLAVAAEAHLIRYREAESLKRQAEEEFEKASRALAAARQAASTALSGYREARAAWAEAACEVLPNVTEGSQL